MLLVERLYHPISIIWVSENDWCLAADLFMLWMSDSDNNAFPVACWSYGWAIFRMNSRAMCMSMSVDRSKCSSRSCVVIQPGSLSRLSCRWYLNVRASVFVLAKTSVSYTRLFLHNLIVKNTLFVGSKYPNTATFNVVNKITACVDVRHVCST